MRGFTFGGLAAAGAALSFGLVTTGRASGHSATPVPQPEDLLAAAVPHAPPQGSASTSPNDAAAATFHVLRPAGPFALPAALPTAPSQELPTEFHEFYFTRAIYSSSGSRFGWGRGGSAWAIDFPKADRQFITVLKRLANLDAYDWENAIRLDDPAIRGFPFLYALEVGRMRLSEAEVEGLRGYLAAGGFLIIDDFWGPWEWENFVREIARVLPSYPIVDLPLSHALYRAFYEIDEILQVPNIDRGATGNPAYYSESGDPPQVKGIFDENGRLIVVINFNTDLGDAWEWMENPYYPLDRSTFAYEMGVNMIVYAMSH